MPDIRIEVVSFDSPTATGLQSITTERLGGVTPKAALIVFTGHKATDDPSSTATARMSIAATDGTHGYYSTSRSANNVSTTDTALSSNNTSTSGGPIIHGATGSSSTFTALAGFSAFIANGIKFNWTTVDASNSYRGFVVLFGGSDLSAFVGSQNLGTGTSALTVTCGFQADVVIGMTADASNALNAAAFALTIGMAARDGTPTQRSISFEESNGISGGRPAQVHRSAKFLTRELPTSAAIGFDVTIGNFTSTTFDLTPSANAASRTVGLLALKFGGASFKVWGFDTPTSTGNASDTTPGFQPTFGLIFGSALEAVDTSKFNDATAGSLQVSAFTYSDSWSAAIRLKNSANPTSTASDVQSSAIAIASDTAMGVAKASFVSFDTSGWTLNYSAASANAKKAIGLAVKGITSSAVLFNWAAQFEPPRPRAKPVINDFYTYVANLPSIIPSFGWYQPPSATLPRQRPAIVVSHSFGWLSAIAARLRRRVYLIS